MFKSKKNKGHSLKRYGRLRVHTVEAPQLVKHILDDTDSFIRPSFIQDMLEKVVKHSLLALDGDKWRENRRLVADVFAPRFIDQNLKPIIFQETQVMSDVWQTSEQVIDVETEMRKLGTKIIARTIFSSSLSDEQAYQFVEATDTLMRVKGPGLINLLPKAMGMSDQIKFPKLSKSQQHAIKTINDILMPVIDSRLANPTDDDDLLSRLIAHIDKDDDLRRDKIRDHIVMFAIAGHETLAGVLTFAVQDVLKSPDVYRQIRDELSGAEIKFDTKLSELPYTTKVFLEALRLHTPAASMLREVKITHKFNEVAFKKGDLVMVEFEALHKNEDFWEEPEDFKPERFENLRDLRDCFIPFSRGPKTCIGRSMSMQQGVMTLAAVFKNNLQPQEFLTGKEEGMTKRPKGRLLVKRR